MVPQCLNLYKKMFYVLWVAIIFTNKISCIEFNLTEYYTMPSLTDLDDYDRCFQGIEFSPTYCFIRADIIPKNDSRVWNAIVNFSKNTNHQFNHRHLHFGICIEWCKQDLRKLSDPDSFFAGVLKNNEKVNIYLKLFHQENLNRERYDRTVNQCVNMRLKKRYQLMAKTVIEYCIANGQIKKEDAFTHAWSSIFFYTVLILLLAVSTSSIYDFYKKQLNESDSSKRKDHYKIPLKSLSNRVIIAFSLPRNWERLIQKPNQKMGRDLRSLDCLKFFSMLFVVYAHVNWIIYEGGITNPHDPEAILRTIVGTILVSGTLITTTFFVISGLLLAINFIAVTGSIDNESGVMIFFKFFLFRYIRLSIPYAFVILLSGVDFSNSGPLSRHINEREQLACRKNWWTNLLYINNFVNTEERCMLQGWYLASDYQAFILSLILLIISFKFRHSSFDIILQLIYFGFYRWPKVRSAILTFAILLSILPAAVYTYAYKVKPIFIPSPQTQRDSFVGDVSFLKFYTPFYMNFGSYFCGVLVGLAYDKIAKNKIDLRGNILFQIFWWSLYPLGILWLMTAHPFWQIDYNIPIGWASIFAALQRNAWAFGVSVVIIGFTSNVGWIFRQFVCLPIFRVLGRLTYGAFILHLFTIRQMIGTIRQPLFFGHVTSFSFTLLSIVLSFFFSLVLAFLIELPLSALLKNLKMNRKESS